MLDPVGRHLRPEKPIPVRRTTISPRLELGQQVLTGFALLAALQFHMLASLLAGLLVYQLVHLLAPSHGSGFVHRRTGKIIIVALLAIVVIAAIGAGILGLISLLSSGSENLSVLLQKMAEVIETARSHLPAWALSPLPEEPAELKAAATAWLREHAGQLRSIGQDVWRTLIRILFGMVGDGGADPCASVGVASRDACHGRHLRNPRRRGCSDLLRLPQERALSP